VGQAVLAVVVIIYAAPLTAAVVITNVLTPAVLLTLIALTEARARAVDRVPAHRPDRGGAGPAVSAPRPGPRTR
jgi:hypothetical protein